MHDRGEYPTQYTYYYLMHENSKGEARGRSIYKNNSKIVRNLEERNVGTIKGKKSQTRPNGAEDLAIDLREGRESPNHRFE